MVYEPASVSPDQLNPTSATAPSGTADLTAGLTVSWQPGGGDPITAWQLTIAPGAGGDPLYTVPRTELDQPFYGADALGNPMTFSVTLPAADLAAAGVVNGDEYRLTVTQHSGTRSAAQSTPSVFRGRTAPVLTLTDLPDPLTGRSHTFTGTFSQAEGDSLQSLRWRLCEAGREDDPFYDSGTITGAGLLQTSWDGFLTGVTYAVRLTGTTSSGVPADTGWQTFPCEYAVGDSPGSVTAVPRTDGGIDLTWDRVESAQGYSILRLRRGEGVLRRLADTDALTGSLTDYSAPAGGSYTYYVFPTGSLAYLTRPMISAAASPYCPGPVLIKAAADTSSAAEASGTNASSLSTIHEQSQLPYKRATAQSAALSESYYSLFTVKSVYSLRWSYGTRTAGTVSNGSSPTVRRAFSAYPTVLPDAVSALSGRITALAGTVTSAAYSESTADTDALFALSADDSPLFLLTPGGRFLRIALSGPVTAAQNALSPLLPQTVTIPWTEIASTAGVSLVRPGEETFTPVDSVIFSTLTLDPASGSLLWTQEDEDPGSVLTLEAGQLLQTADEEADYAPAELTLSSAVLYAHI